MRWVTVSHIVSAASVTLALVLGAGLFVELTREDWKPLGPFPVQDVSADLEVELNGTAYPAVRLGDEVDVTGTKCYREPVQVTGDLSWASVYPAGLAVEIGSGGAERDAGCIDLEFHNPIPPVVAAWAEQRFADGFDFVIVRVTGKEIASRNGDQSVPLTWRTEDFALLPGVGDG